MSHCKPHCNVFTCNSLSLTFIVSSLSRIMLFSCSIILPWASHCMARSLSAIMSLLPFGYRQTYILMHIVNNGYFFLLLKSDRNCYNLEYSSIIRIINQLISISLIKNCTFLTWQQSQDFFSRFTIFSDHLHW